MSWLSRLVEGRATWVDGGTLERPSRPLIDAFTLGESLSFATGVLVTPLQAAGMADVFSCISVIADDVARVPKSLVTIDGAGNETKIEHPLSEALTSLANPETTAFDFLHDLIWDLYLHERAFAQIERLRNGAVHFWRLDPSRVRVDRTPSGVKRWQIIGDGGQVAATHLFDPDKPPVFELRKRSPIHRIKGALGLTAAIEQYGASFFANGARLSGLISVPTATGDTSMGKLEQLFKSLFSGAENAHKFAILKGDVKYTPFSAQNEEAQFLESRKHQRSVVCGAFRVPPHKIAELERATFSNIEQQEIEYVHGLDPLFEAIRQALRRDVLSIRQFPRYDIRFDRSVLTTGDFATQVGAVNTAINSGAMTINDGRRKLGLNTVDPAIGDVHLVNGNLVPASVAARQAPSAPAAGAPADPDAAGDAGTVVM